MINEYMRKVTSFMISIYLNAYLLFIKLKITVIETRRYEHAGANHGSLGGN